MSPKQSAATVAHSKYKTTRSVYSPTDFMNWREVESLELTPKFQRRETWKLAARSFFIDTLLREMPVPPLYLREIQGEGKKKIVNQVVDGQQRLRAVLDFVDGKFSLSRNLKASWKGKSFEDLDEDEQQRVTSYEFSTEKFKGLSDADVLEVFSRLNMYSTPLNAQELRNGRFFGPFKQSVYLLAREHLSFWRRNRIFSEARIARMAEAQLCSELLVAQLDGMQDKKSSIDEFYGLYEDKFEDADQIVDQFTDTIDTIDLCFPDGLAELEFRRTPLFYTLFCVVFHRRYGLPNQEPESPTEALTKSDRNDLFEATNRLSELISLARSEEGRAKIPKMPAKDQEFVNACLRQTDNIKPRETRFKLLYERSFE